MKAGWVGNHELQALVLAKDGGAAFHPEVVTIEDEHVKVVRSEWDAGTFSGVDTLPAGGARLALTGTATITHTPAADTTVTGLSHIAPFEALRIEWLDALAETREIKSLVANLDPRANGGNPKTVAYFEAQLFRIAQVLNGDVVGLVPISRPVRVAASGEVAADFTFDFQDAGVLQRCPVVGPPPTGEAVATTRPVTVVQITALQDDGTLADNVAWSALAATSSITDSATYSVTVWTYSDIGAAFAEEVGGSVFLEDTQGSAMPLFTLNRAAYSEETVTFEGAAEIPDLTGSGDLVIVARGETPADSMLTYEISDDGGMSWEECFDGDVIGEDNADQGGGDLSGISTTGPWDMRVTLTPSTSGFESPIARALGVQCLTSTWLTGAATLMGGHRQVDPVTLRGNIAAAELVIAKTGEADYRDIGSRILSQNHIGEIHVRLWLASTVRSDLARSKWMLHSVWDIDDYWSDDTAHRIQLASPLARLRNVIIPPFVVTTGTNGERIAVTVPSSPGTIADAYDEIMDGMSALPGRLRGPSPDDDTNNVQKEIRRSEKKEELDRLAYLSGGAIAESQGRIGFVKMMRDDAAFDTPVAFFPWGSYTPGEFGPGYSTRTDEFFVPYNWNENGEFFEDERRYLNAVALEKLGGVGLNTTQRLDDETAKWITTETLADLVGNRVPQHFATGQIIWPIRSHYRHPALECGDVVSIETTRFAGRSPLNDTEIRGRVSALAIVTQVRDPWGTEFELWVPSFDKIVPAQGTVTPGYDAAAVPFHADTDTDSVTGTTSETTLRTITIPAYRMGKSGGFEIRALVNVTGTASSKSLRMKWDGTNFVLASYTSGETGYGELVGRVTNKASYSAQRTVGRNVKAGAVGYSTSDLTVDTTADVDITITGELGDAGDQIDLVDTIVQFFGTG